MSNGRVTTKEFYEALLDQNKQRADMEARLSNKLDGIHSHIAGSEAKFIAMDKACVDIKKRIDTNAADIKKVGGINGIATIVAATIAGIIGTQK